MRDGNDHPSDVLTGSTFSPTDARFDRIQIERSCGTLQGTRHAFELFKQILPQKHDVGDGQRHCIFSKASGTYGWVRWTVIGGRVPEDTRARPGAPLFSGNLTAFPCTPTDFRDGDRYQWKLVFRLSLNPSRWLNHEDQWQVPRLLVPPQQGMSDDEYDAFARDALRNHPANLFARELPPNGTDDVLLIQGDNASEGSSRRQSLFSRSKRDIHLQRYYAGIIILVDQLFADVAETAGLRIFPDRNDVRLREIEAYWEVPREDPIGDVQRLERDIRAAVAECSTSLWRPSNQQARAYLQRKISTGRLQNSPCIKASVGLGAMLRIYAKTTKRVRFEVEFKTRLCHTDFLRFTGDDQSFVEWCQRAADRGSRKITSIRDTIAASVRERASRRTFTADALLQAVCDAAESIDAGFAILRSIVANGSYALPQYSTSRPVIEVLKTMKVLRHYRQTGGNHLYVVARAYRPALEQLRQVIGA
jgi:hypothetical protein